MNEVIVSITLSICMLMFSLSGLYLFVSLSLLIVCLHPSICVGNFLTSLCSSCLSHFLHSPPPSPFSLILSLLLQRGKFGIGAKTLQIQTSPQVLNKDISIYKSQPVTIHPLEQLLFFFFSQEKDHPATSFLFSHPREQIKLLPCCRKAESSNNTTIRQKSLCTCFNLCGRHSFQRY